MNNAEKRIAHCMVADCQKGRISRRTIRAIDALKPKDAKSILKEAIDGIIVLSCMVENNRP